MSQYDDSHAHKEEILPHEPTPFLGYELAAYPGARIALLRIVPCVFDDLAGIMEMYRVSQFPQEDSSRKGKSRKIYLR